MDPTLVAPTAVIEKNPCAHSPMYTARSFKTNKSGSNRAIFGLTLNNSPVTQHQYNNYIYFLFQHLEMFPIYLENVFEI